MNNPSSDQKLVKFLNQHRPNLPEAAPELEQKVLAAIESSEVNSIDENNWKKTRLTASLKYRKRFESSVCQWILPAAIAAGLLVFGSGYRAFNTAQLPDDETAHLEAFLVTNWEGVLHDYRTENTSSPQADWLTFPATADTEPPTNNGVQRGNFHVNSSHFCFSCFNHDSREHRRCNRSSQSPRSGNNCPKSGSQSRWW